MAIIHSIFSWIFKKRLHDIEFFIKYPVEVQEEVLRKLLETSKNTVFGRQYGFSQIETIQAYQERVPLSNYEAFFPWIDRVIKGEQNVIWPKPITWFAKSSGTTNSRSKFIPVSRDSLDGCHYKGGKDLVAVYLSLYENSQLFTGKGLVMGGSHQMNVTRMDVPTNFGDVSAVMMHNLPFWAHFARTPSLDVALMDNWEEKLDKIMQSTQTDNVTSLAGVPTWTLVLLEKMLEQSSKTDIREIWPNLEVFFHGAVSFRPYKSVFRQLIPHDDMRYMETYNASEGFFAIQDQKDSEDLLLMLDYGGFYEFIPSKESNLEHPKVLTLSDVVIGENYELVITTNSGLWRYRIGDTIRFTSLSPHRIRISGRTKHFINAFGEEVVIDNAEEALTAACLATHASVEDYTCGPKYLDRGQQGAHEWIVEFRSEPNDFEHFVQVLDVKLREVNSDYDAKRSGNIALLAPVVHLAPPKTFYQWMKQQGKLGGQHKVPRLSNDRTYLDAILPMVGAL